jgi:hypothetical protein
MAEPASIFDDGFVAARDAAGTVFEPKQSLSAGSAEPGLPGGGANRKVAYQLYDPEAEAQHTPLNRFWRAQWNLKPRGPACLPFVVRLTWYLQVVGFVISVHDGIDGDLNGAFFWSRTSCCGVSSHGP